MTEEQAKEIFEKTLALTKEGRLDWKRSGENEYKMGFTRSNLMIRESPDYDPPLYELCIYNEDGVLVAKVADDDEVEAEAGVKRFTIPGTRDLFAAVQDRIFKYQETAIQVLDALQRLERGEGTD